MALLDVGWDARGKEGRAETPDVGVFNDVPKTSAAEETQQMWCLPPPST